MTYMPCKSVTAKAREHQREQSRETESLKEFLSARQENILLIFKALFNDFVKLNPSYRQLDSARDFKTLSKRFTSEGLGFLSVTLPSLMQGLFDHVEGRKPLYVGFKLKANAEYPLFLSRLFEEVYNDGTNKEVAFSQIYQICVVFKKLRGPYKKSMLREETRSFVEVDEEIGRIDFTAEPLQPILANAKHLIDVVFRDIDVDPPSLLPRPGPGATNTPVDKYLRFRPHVVYIPLDDEFSYFDVYYTHCWDPVRDAKRYMSLPQMEEAESRLKFVPKYLGKPRAICIEENEMQFFQQAIKRKLYNHLELHPATRGRVNFSSQERNRSLALTASKDKKMATLDMSAASDRVARELVYRLFWDTKLFHQLDAISTRKIKLPDGSIHLAHKFAPMGSGVCFPVMAIIHWALVRSIIKLSSIADSEKLSKEVYVYGDDIIIDSSAVECVYTYLPLFGMKLNETKSFSKGPFRESCGIHAYNGLDVTPVYVNHVIKHDQADNDVTTLLSLIAKESLFEQRRLYETSQCVRNLVQKHYWLMPYVGMDSPVLGWRRDGVTCNVQMSYHARKSRYNEDLQCLEYNVQTVVPRRKPGQYLANLSQDDAYLRYLLTHAKDSALMPGDVDDLEVSRRWVPMSGI